MSHALKHIPFELKGDDEPSSSDLVQKAIENFHGKFDDFKKHIEEKSLDASKIIDRLSKLEAKANRTGTFANDNAAKDNELERKAFREYLSKGVDESKSLRVADSTGGGYLAPKQYETAILTSLILFSPVRAAAAVANTSASSVIYPKETGEVNAFWTGETETRTATTTAFGQDEIFNYEMASYIDISFQLLEDSAIDLESFIGGRIGKKFGQIEAAAFVNGDGVKKPSGFMLDPNVGQFLNGDAAVLKADAIVGLPYSLPAPYRNAGAWMMNKNTLAAVRLLKDSQNRYLWQPALVAGQPETLGGYPVFEAPDMPDVGANAFPIVFGDFKTAYSIFDRVGLEIFTDIVTQRATGCARIWARRRVGALTTVPAALTKLKIATA